MDMPLMTPLYAVLVTVLVTLSCATASKVVPAELVPGRFPGQKAYTVHVFAGTPPEPLHFEVSFKSNRVILYRDQRAYSVSYNTEGASSSEIFYFGSDRTRLPVVFDPDRILYEEHSHCASCDGMLGLGIGSVLWQRWSGATFTSASLTLGGLNPLMQFGERGCSGCIVECDTASADVGGMCLTRGHLENYRADGSAPVDGVVSESGSESDADNAYPVIISVDNPITYLPRELYDRYMHGKNIYTDNAATDWEALRIRLSAAPLLLQQDGAGDGFSRINTTGTVAGFQGMGLGVASCDTQVRLEIDPESLVKTFEVEGRTLLLRENSDANDSTITLGNALWAQFIFYRETSGQYVYVQHHTVHAHISIPSLLIFAALLWYMVRWKMTDISVKTEDVVVPGRINWLNAFYEYTAPFLALTALLLPVARDIVGDFPLLYAFSVVIFSFAAVADLLVISAWIFISVRRTDSGKRRASTRRRRVNYLRRHSHNVFRVNFLRNVTHETLLMIGMWVVLAEGRSEGIASVLTVVVNFYNLYNITFHSILFLTYVLYVGRRGAMQNGIDNVPSVVWSLSAAVIPMMLGFQLFASYTYFTVPLLMRQAQIYEEIVLPSIALIYVFIVTLSIYMVTLYMRRAMLRIVRDGLKSARHTELEQSLTDSRVLSMRGFRVGAANANGNESKEAEEKKEENEDEHEKEEEEEDSAAGLASLIDKGQLAVITGLVSNFAFDIVNLRPNRLELSILVILVYLAFFAIYDALVSWLKNLGVLKRNKEWKEVLLAVLYFVNMLGKFVVLQVLLELLKEGIGGSDPNVLEAAVGIYALMLVGVSLVHTVKALST